MPRVDIVSAPGISLPGVFRRGTAQALVTGRCVFLFQHGRFVLHSIHPGETVTSIRANTGFAFDEAEATATPDPTTRELELLRSEVRHEMRETYPEFCRKIWGADPVGRAA